MEVGRCSVVAEFLVEVVAKNDDSAIAVLDVVEVAEVDAMACSVNLREVQQRLRGSMSIDWEQIASLSAIKCPGHNPRQSPK